MKGEEREKGKENMWLKEGKKDKELKKHLRYHLVDSKELTWENALKLAMNWEIAYGTGTSMAEEEVESVSAVEVKSSELRIKRKERTGMEELKEDAAATASLSDQVRENRMRIEKLELGQEKINATLVELSSKMDSVFGWLESCGGDVQEGGGEEAELEVWE